MQDILSLYAETVRDITCSISTRVLETAWRGVLDQQIYENGCLISTLSVIGDQTLPARKMTRERCWYRIAGPKEGIHVPFVCPAGLDPLEVTLAGSNETVTGLGIKRREVFAITGFNAQGKTSLVEAIVSEKLMRSGTDGNFL